MTDRPTTVVEAMAAVMEDVRTVRKTERNTSQNFSFRGIDATVNAIGPALRKHGVVVVPLLQGFQSETVEVGQRRTPMSRMLLTVTYRFYGPQGDHIDSTVLGESFDAGDKATPKAMSVAFRTALLQAFCLPTDDPDPDTQSYERASHHGDDGYDPLRTTRTDGPVADDPWAQPPVTDGYNDRGAGPSPVLPATTKQLGMVGGLFTDKKPGLSHAERLEFVNGLLDEPIQSSHDMTRAQASKVIDALKALPEPASLGEYQD